MRQVTDADRIERVMAALADAARAAGRVYFTGGTTAVLLGWRPSTVDVDLKLVPESDEILRAIAPMKERLEVNVELASPADFIPVPAGWEDRGLFIRQVGRLSFFHFDLYAQALSKIERGHQRDLADVAQMVQRGLVDPAKARDYFTRIEPQLFRFPAIDPPTFRRAVEEFFGT